MKAKAKAWERERSRREDRWRSEFEEGEGGFLLRVEEEEGGEGDDADNRAGSTATQPPANGAELGELKL